MQRISQSIKHFNAGISQQPPQMRTPEQLEEQTNCFSSETDGLIKRPPLVQAGIANNIRLKENEDYYFHLIDRGDGEKNIVVAGKEHLHILSIDKDTQDITESASFDLNGYPYLKTEHPSKDLRMLTIADHTFLLNKRKSPTLGGAKTTSGIGGYLVNILTGHYGRTYSVTVQYMGDESDTKKNVMSSVSFSYTTPDGSAGSHSVSIGTDKIAAQLATQAKAAGFTKVQQEGSWLLLQELTKDSYPGKTTKNTTFHGITVTDGADNAAAIGVADSIAKFAHLPMHGPDGYLVCIKGDASTHADDYYVKYDKSKGRWVECAKGGLLPALNKSLMPMLLKSLGEGRFELEEATWDERDCGDDKSNPPPSFVGHTISDIFLFRNRLGFLSGENVILSESGSYFNFWMTTATEVLDTDPLDLSVSYPSIVNLEHAVVFQEALVLFAAETQFILYAQGALTPKTAFLKLLSAYTCDTDVRPTAAGERIYYTTRRGSYSIVRELYATGTIEDAKLTNDITSHIPAYLASPLYAVWENTTENFLIFLSAKEQDTIYLYKYLFLDGQRIQSAWSKWTFEGTYIKGAGFIGNTLYLLYTYTKTGEEAKEGGIALIGSINTASHTRDDADKDFESTRVYLDSKLRVSDRTELPLSTIKELPYYSLVKAGKLELQLMDIDGSLYTLDRADDTKAQRLLDTIKLPYVLGISYEAKAVLSPIYVRDEQRENRAVTQGRLQLDHLNLEYSKTGIFDVSVTRNHKNKETFRMTGRTTGSLTAKNNSPIPLELSSGTYRIPLHSDTLNLQIEVISKNPYPLNITGASWEGRYYAPMRRI
jgi:tail tubular protein B|nr:MAG TPA: stabilization protein [Caudoviricetes sp.]